MEETDPFLDPNPFAALDGDDGVQHTPTQQANPPLQQPLSPEELELEAINAQQALLQASSGSAANTAKPSTTAFPTLSGAPTASPDANNPTDYLQQSEEKAEPPPEQLLEV